MRQGMLFVWTTCVLCTAAAWPRGPGGTEGGNFEPEVWGVLVRVPAIAPAVDFYSEVLGFEVAGFVGQDAALLRSGELHLWLGRADGPAAAGEEAGSYVNFHVPDLERASEAVVAAGGDAGEPEVFPLGRSVDAHDPWGNRLHLLHVTVGAVAGREEIGVFNVGLTSTSYGSLEPFLVGLGFEVFSRDYLPTALPFRPSGAAALVAHDGAALAANGPGRRTALLLSVPDVEATAAVLLEKGLGAGGKPRPGPYGRTMSLRSPAGLELRLVERSPAQLAFERFRSLAGSWKGESTAGWEARIEFEVIARGSVVLERSNFDAHPNETMVTAYHRDGARLVLTHYCVAGNQPTMEACEFADDGLAFAFAGATNIDSRDDGHMDAARFTFKGADRFQAKWSWYQDGEESWMEEIRYERE